MIGMYTKRSLFVNISLIAQRKKKISGGVSLAYDEKRNQVSRFEIDNFD